MDVVAVRTAVMLEDPYIVYCQNVPISCFSKLNLDSKQSEQIQNGIFGAQGEMAGLGYSELVGNCFQQRQDQLSISAAGIRRVGADGTDKVNPLQAQLAKSMYDLQINGSTAEMSKYTELGERFLEPNCFGCQMSRNQAEEERKFRQTVKSWIGVGSDFAKNELDSLTSNLTAITVDYKKVREVTRAITTKIGDLNKILHECLDIMAKAGTTGPIDRGDPACFEKYRLKRVDLMTDPVTAIVLASSELSDKTKLSTRLRDVGRAELQANSWDPVSHVAAAEANFNQNLGIFEYNNEGVRKRTKGKKEYYGHVVPSESDVRKAMENLGRTAQSAKRNLPEAATIPGDLPSNDRYRFELDRLLESNPRVAMKIIAHDPKSAPLICSMMQRIDSRKKHREETLGTMSTVSGVMAAVLGFGPMLLTKIPGVSNVTAMVNKAVLGGRAGSGVIFADLALAFGGAADFALTAEVFTRAASVRDASVLYASTAFDYNGNDGMFQVNEDAAVALMRDRNALLTKQSLLAFSAIGVSARPVINQLRK